MEFNGLNAVKTIVEQRSKYYKDRYRCSGMDSLCQLKKYIEILFHNQGVRVSVQGKNLNILPWALGNR